MSACPACTFVNDDPNWSACAMCGTANPVPPTDISCPVCGRSVPLAQAEQHVNACLSGLGAAAPAAQGMQVSAAVARGRSVDDFVDLTDSSSSSSSSPSSSAPAATPAAPAARASAAPAAAPARAGPKPKTLTSEEQVVLLGRALLLDPRADASGAAIVDLLRRVRSHIDAEEEEEAASEAKGSYSWEYRTGSGVAWRPYEKTQIITIEGERRSGNPSAQFQDRQGRTITVDLNAMRDSRGYTVRAVPAGSAAAAGSETKSSSAAAAAADTMSGNGTECAVCMCEFGSEVTPFRVAACGHAVLCTGCVKHYLAQKVRDKDIFPWIACPNGGCRARLGCRELVDALGGGSDPLPRALCTTYLQKWIVRYPEWTPCTDSGCKYGFLVANKMEGKRQRCGVCRRQQVVRRRKEEQDEGLKKMIADGVLRPCPKCKLLTMKEYGVCNVIDCQQCGIVWNWRTRETARTSAELKRKARQKGTLWEAGELDYQRTLQHTNKKAFIALLERNGVKYNPNYRRGS